MTFTATPLHNNPCPGGYVTYNYNALFIGHHSNILSLSDLCVELKVLNEIMHFHYITYMAKL